jgi:uncharacterized protein (UPF0261 family)
MAARAKTIGILVTLDTKWEETAYMKSLLEKRGYRPLVLDVGTRGTAPYPADYSCEEMARAGGRSLADIHVGPHGYMEIMSTVAAGAKKVVENLVAEGKIDGLLSIGGGMGTSTALLVMRELPLSLPKLLLSTVAFVTEVVSTEKVSLDQAVMQSPADLYGVNRITEVSLRRAVGAICGMVEMQEEEKGQARRKPLVAISTLGVHRYVDRCQALLKERGYDPVVFHAQGSLQIEKLIRWGYVHAALDLCVYELVNYVSEGVEKGGEEKYTAACEKGIPQIISLGALDFFPLPTSIPLPPKLEKRKSFVHGLIHLIQTSPQEQEKVAEMMAETLNKGRGPMVVLIPLRGFSNLDSSPEMPFYEPQAGKRFSTALRIRLHNPLARIEEIDAHINEPAFAEKAIDLLFSIMK